MSEGIKIHLELTGPLAERFRRAYEAIRVGGPAALVRRMAEDWLTEWEARGSPGLESPMPPRRNEKPRAGSR